MVNHDEEEWEWQGKRYICKPGQKITSLEKIRKACGKGVSIQNIRTAFVRFEKLEFLTYESTKESRLVTVLNWELYQSSENNQQSNQQTGNKDLTTNKNDKNDKNKDIEVLHTSLSTEVDPIDKIPYQEIVNLYHLNCVSYPKLKTIGSNRQKAISARWKQYKKDLAVFEILFQKAEQSGFLKGENNRNWQADFNWLMNDANMAKVLEGKYDKKLCNTAPHQPTIAERKDAELQEALRRAHEEGEDNIDN